MSMIDQSQLAGLDAWYNPLSWGATKAAGRWVGRHKKELLIGGAIAAGTTAIILTGGASSPIVGAALTGAKLLGRGALALGRGAAKVGKEAIGLLPGVKEEERPAGPSGAVAQVQPRPGYADPLIPCLTGEAYAPRMRAMGEYGLGAIPWFLNPIETSKRFWGGAARLVGKAGQKAGEVVSNLPPVKAVREAKQAVEETTAGVSGIIGDIGNIFQSIAKIMIYGGLGLLAWQLFKPTGLVGRELPYGVEGKRRRK
ncbi:MAG: hypothetical protein ABIM19_07910 [candidate division WOR-3 bacterium]